MKAAEVEARYRKARAMQRQTATRIRRLITALQNWQQEADKLERQIDPERLAHVIHHDRIKETRKRLTSAAKIVNTQITK